MAAVEAPRRSERGQQRACRLRLQAGARPVAGELLVVRGRVQLHLDSHRRHRVVRVRLPERGTGRVVDVAGRRRRPDPGRAVLHGDGRAVSDRRLGLPMVQAGLGAGFISWMTGWIYIVGAIVTIAAVAVDWQVVLPQITHQFQILGSSADAGAHDHQGRGAERAAARGDPGRHHDHDQHARRQADGAHQQRRRGRRADRLDPADHPAAVPPAPPAVGHRPQLRLRRRASLGLLRCAARSADS